MSISGNTPHRMWCVPVVEFVDTLSSKRWLCIAWILIVSFRCVFLSR